MSTLIIIPARYDSGRLPGKPLADIKGKPMIQHVYERIAGVFDNVVVATDDTRIEKAVKAFSGACVMTSPTHQSGTDRCAEALQIIEKNESRVYETIINVQGDEPLIDSRQIKELDSLLANPSVQIATLIKKINNTTELFDTNTPKVVIGKNNRALYFSRQCIPYFRDADKNDWANKHSYYKHIGIYGFKPIILKEIVKLDVSLTEKAEKLEQNRWLENGYHIQCGITTYNNFSVDTEDDLKKINMLF